MSVYARTRKKRRRQFKVFIRNSENVEGVLVFQIHEIPTRIDYGCEFDFWVIDKKDCYMLRIIKSKEQAVYFTRSNLSNPLYCIMKIDIDDINIKEMLLLLKTIGIPYKIKGEVKRRIRYK